MTIEIKIKRQSVTEFVNDALSASLKTQKEIADKMGLENANIGSTHETEQIPR